MAKINRLHSRKFVGAKKSQISVELHFCKKISARLIICSMEWAKITEEPDAETS